MARTKQLPKQIVLFNLHQKLNTLIYGTNEYISLQFRIWDVLHAEDGHDILYYSKI